MIVRRTVGDRKISISSIISLILAAILAILGAVPWAIVLVLAMVILEVARFVMRHRRRTKPHDENRLATPKVSLAKFCQHCGRALEPDLRFCPYCGKERSG